AVADQSAFRVCQATFTALARARAGSGDCERNCEQAVAAVRARWAGIQASKPNAMMTASMANRAVSARACPRSLLFIQTLLLEADRDRSAKDENWSPPVGLRSGECQRS